jgi:glucose-6-phosphate isomerase
MHAIDPRLWTDDPVGQAEVRIRLGWLHLPETSRSMINEINTFVREIQEADFSHALLLGMGGSSLAPEVMNLVFAGQVNGLRFSILDSTDPGQVIAAARRSPAKKTLYIVSSKSGGTAEVNAFLDYFWARTHRIVGKEVNQHFIAITDPNTSLHKLALERGFRKIFKADPNVGGRYSALTAFGIIPAGLMGIDLDTLLGRARYIADQCAANIPEERNPGLVLGAILGEAVRHGRDKLTIIADQRLISFGSWLEQLVAESSGKQNVGIVPVDGEPVAAPQVYGNDRLFIYLRYDGKHDRQCARLRKAGHPVLTINVPDSYALGAEFYRWEVATAVACIILGVNAFDQPDVQDAKTQTKDKIADYLASGVFDGGKPVWEGQGVRVYGDLPSGITGLNEALEAFLALGKAGDYVALNAFLPRNAHNKTFLRKLRIAIRARTRLATTVGFGPRFLHSGQLHKGGENNGMFYKSPPIRLMMSKSLVRACHSAQWNGVNP